MTPEPIIAKITDPEAGQVEMLMEAQLLINERNAWKRALELCLLFDLSQGDLETVQPNAQGWYRKACEQLESEKINGGKVC